MPGPVALIGAGEFLPTMAELDRGLLEATGRSRPRVAIVPTASFPDGEDAFQRWAEMGRTHFEELGAEVETVLVRGRADADDPANAQAVGEADVVYLSGGKPAYLRAALEGSAVWRSVLAAHAQGAVLVGCSAGAMVLAERQAEFGRLAPPIRWGYGLNVVPGVGVLPHYDAWPEPIAVLVRLRAPRHLVVLGLDDDTAVIGRDGAWQVEGRSRVTVWRGLRRERHRRGDVFRI